MLLVNTKGSVNKVAYRKPHFTTVVHGTEFTTSCGTIWKIIPTCYHRNKDEVENIFINCTSNSHKCIGVNWEALQLHTVYKKSYFYYKPWENRIRYLCASEHNNETEGSYDEIISL